MKTCSCHEPARPATHKGTAGRLLCAETAARVTRNAAWLAERLTPTPLDPTLWETR